MRAEKLRRSIDIAELAKKGFFITFEGVEGAGKTTQIALLRTALERERYIVCVTREPGGDAFAESIRSLLLHHTMTPRAELLLFLASRAQNVEQVIRPQLAAGSVVICDRFIDSSIAYQGCARGLGRETVAALNTFATDELVPDLTMLLDLPPAIGLSRQTDRNRMEEESLPFHERVREGFLTSAANEPLRFHVLDASEPPELIHERIVTIVFARLQENPAQTPPNN